MTNMKENVQIAMKAFEIIGLLVALYFLLRSMI